MLQKHLYRERDMPPSLVLRYCDGGSLRPGPTPATLLPVESRNCPTCRSSADDDATFCDQCGWPIDAPPGDLSHRFSVALTVAMIAFLCAFVVRWSEARDGLAVMRAGWSGMRSEYAEARADAITWTLANRVPKALVGRYVLWDVTPAGQGFAFYEGSENSPIRLVGAVPGVPSWPSGKSVGSLTMLGRLKDDGKPGPAVEPLLVF
jgi:hypothetical protein